MIEEGIYPLFFYAHYSQDWHPAARGTGGITYNIEGIDEEFREFCPAGCVPGKLNHIKADSIGLGVVGSLVGQEPNNSVYLAPFKYISTHESFVPQYLILCSNCGEDHSSGQFSNCSAKLEIECPLML